MKWFRLLVRGLALVLQQFRGLHRFAFKDFDHNLDVVKITVVGTHATT